MSSRKKITILVSVLILVILILVLPFLDGILFKNKVEKLVGQVGPRYHIKLMNYKRGWFTSEFQLATHDKLVNKTETYHVTHGPFVIYQRTPQFVLGKVSFRSNIKNIGTANGSGVVSLFGNITMHSQLHLDDSLLDMANMMLAISLPNAQLKISPITITSKISSKLDHVYNKLTIPTLSIVTTKTKGINLQVKNIIYTVNATKQSSNDWIADMSFGIGSAKVQSMQIIKADLENLQINNLRINLNKVKKLKNKDLSDTERQLMVLQAITAMPTVKFDKLSFTDPLNNFDASGLVSWPGFKPAPSNPDTLLADMNFNFKFQGSLGYLSKIVAAQKLESGAQKSSTLYYIPLDWGNNNSDALYNLGVTFIARLVQQGYIKQANGVYTFSISKNKQNILLNNQKPASLEAAYLSLIFRVNLDNSTQQIQTLAGQNNRYAQYLLGRQYLRGIGVVKNQNKGLLLLKKSALQGNIVAQEQLAIIYRFGLEGVPKNIAQSIKWYKNGICDNRDFSAGGLSVMYFFGIEMPGDYAKAYKYMYMLGPKGRKSLSKYLQMAAKHLTKKQIKQAKALPSCLTNAIRPLPLIGASQ